MELEIGRYHKLYLLPELSFGWLLPPLFEHTLTFVFKYTSKHCVLLPPTNILYHY